MHNICFNQMSIHPRKSQSLFNHRKLGYSQSQNINLMDDQSNLHSYFGEKKKMNENKNDERLVQIKPKNKKKKKMIEDQKNKENIGFTVYAPSNVLHPLKSLAVIPKMMNQMALSKKKYQISSHTLTLLSNFGETYSNHIHLIQNEVSTISDCLQKHYQISTGNRAAIVSWMMEVLSNYKQSLRTVFLSVAIMDNYMKKKPKEVSPRDYYLIGLASMMLASKMEDVVPIVLETAYDHIGHLKFTKEEIHQMEMGIFKVLEYKIPSLTILDFCECYGLQIHYHFANNTSNGIILKLMHEIKKIVKRYSLLCLYDLNLQKLCHSSLASGTLLSAFYCISVNYNHKYDHLLENWIYEFASRNTEHISTMQNAALKIIDLENYFEDFYGKFENYLFYDYIN